MRAERKLKEHGERTERQLRSEPESLRSIALDKMRSQTNIVTPRAPDGGIKLLSSYQQNISPREIKVISWLELCRGVD